MMLKLVVLAVTIGCAFAAYPIKDSVSWSGGPFHWPREDIKGMFTRAGKYVNKNIIATRSVIYKNQAVLALPRFKKGVPATIATLPLDCKHGRPTLSPFPCWSLHEEGDCRSFQNVVDLFLDPQNILWVLDTGIVDSLEDPVSVCPPKVVAINMKTGKLVQTIDLGPLTEKISRLQYVIADYSTDGRAFIYVTDAATNMILVYDVTSGCGYRVILPKETMMGAKRRDVLYPSLIRRADGSSVLLFSYLSGCRLFSIRTDYLQNNTNNAKIRDLGKMPKKMVMLGTDNGSAVFFRYEGEPDVYRWDAATAFCAQNFIKVASGDGCSMATQVVPDYSANGGRGGMRILETNAQDFVRGTVGCGVDHSLSVM